MGLLAMDGFKNSTKTQYSMGGYAKGGSKGTAKVGKVMGEFKAGTLHSGSKKGPEVTNPKQAVAIALSEARKAGAKLPVKKQFGGALTDVERRLLQTDMNDMGPADRARALKMLGTPVVKKTSTTVVVAPAPKKDAVKPTGMTDAEKRMNDIEKNEMGGYKKGGPAKHSRTDALRAQKYKAAMASRPNREPIVSGGPSSAASLAPLIRRAMAAKAAQAAAAPPMAAPPMMGAPPAMKKGGKVTEKGSGEVYASKAAMKRHEAKESRAEETAEYGKVSKRQDGGMATSIRPTKDYNASDKDFVSARAEQLKGIVGKAEGGKADLKQDKAMVKAAIHKHERHDHPGKPLTKLRKGGMPC